MIRKDRNELSSEHLKSLVLAMLLGDMIYEDVDCQKVEEFGGFQDDSSEDEMQ